MAPDSEKAATLAQKCPKFLCHLRFTQYTRWVHCARRPSTTALRTIGFVGTMATFTVRPKVTITDYTWVDCSKSVKVWVKVPGVHNLPAANV
eukprot:450166-Pyramimonas_sp.AAC.1